MTHGSGLFASLSGDLRRHLAAASTTATVSGWATSEGCFVGCETARDVLDQVMDPTGGDRRGRAELGVLLCWATDDVLAAEVVFAACLPGLAAVGGQLGRVWGTDRAEVDQAVAAAGWLRLSRVAGRRWEWPDRVIIGGARIAVRDELRSAARSESRLEPLGDAEPMCPVGDPTGLEAAELISIAVRRGVVSAGSARLVWATRVLGVPATEIAAECGERPRAVVMRRLRAERALRRNLLSELAVERAG